MKHLLGLSFLTVILISGYIAKAQDKISDYGFMRVVLAKLDTDSINKLDIRGFQLKRLKWDHNYYKKSLKGIIPRKNYKQICNDQREQEKLPVRYFSQDSLKTVVIDSFEKKQMTIGEQYFHTMSFPIFDKHHTYAVIGLGINANGGKDGTMYLFKYKDHKWEVVKELGYWLN